MMEKRAPRQLAIFDLDETLTLKDTTIRFLFFHAGYLKGTAAFILSLPTLIAAVCGFRSWASAKERVFITAFGGRSVVTMKERGDTFARDYIPGLLHPVVYPEMKQLQAAGFEALVLTASCRLWIEKWCELEKTQLICTELEETSGLYTGRLSGANCHGKEKLNRLLAAYDFDQIERVVAYGNLPPDIHYLRVAHQAFVVNGKKVTPL